MHEWRFGHGSAHEGLATSNGLHYCGCMSTKDALLIEIERFLKRTGIAPTRFGEESCGERSLIKRLKRGGRISTDTYDRIKGYMHARRHDRPKSRAQYQPAA